jgi:hypothetical protein
LGERLLQIHDPVVRVLDAAGKTATISVPAYRFSVIPIR